MRPARARTHRSRRSLAPHLALLLGIAGIAACSDNSLPVAPRMATAPALGVNNGGNNRRILFVDNGIIYSMNPDGSDVTQLTNPPPAFPPAFDRSPAWSPDGKQIAFVRQDAVDGAGEIYVMNADGSALGRLTFSAGNDLMPTWSKDGKRIAFVSARDDPSPVTASSDGWDIYVMNADGSDVSRLTDTRGVDRDPSWSMDGKQIAFVSSRDGRDQATTDIYVVTVDNLQVTRLTAEGADVGDPSWAPGGKQIAFTAGDFEASNTDVFVMNADGTQLTRLTDGPDSPGADANPTWSPDGKMIAFTSSRASDHYDVFTMNANGTAVTRLTRSATEKIDPAWNR